MYKKLCYILHTTTIDLPKYNQPNDPEQFAKRFLVIQQYAEIWKEANEQDQFHHYTSLVYQLF